MADLFSEEFIQKFSNLSSSCLDLKSSYDSIKIRFDKIISDLVKLENQFSSLESANTLLDSVLAKIRGFYGN